MKIACWNVNSIKARLEGVLAWVRDNRPDVLLLQELKCENVNFPVEFFEDLGYNITIYGQKTYNGVAILSKFPIEDAVRGLPMLPIDPQARYLEVFTGGVRLASVYVPNGEEVGSSKFEYKMSFFKALESHLGTLLSADECIVVGGDFNVAPHKIDVYDPSLLERERILCSRDEREAMRRLINLGYVDGLRHQYPATPNLFTWWDYRAGSWPQNKGMRIDHFLLNPQATQKMSDCFVDSLPRAKEKPSDHAPIVLCLLN